MYSRVTDDYEKMALAGIKTVIEPSFWLGQERTSSKTLTDYWQHIISFERERADQFGINHYCAISINPKEANNIQLANESLNVIKDFLNQNLSTDPKFMLETHVTRDFAEYLWGSVDFTYITGGKSSVNGGEGESINTLQIGGTLGYYLNDNFQIVLGYLTTINDNDPTDLSMDGYKITLVYGWHKIIEGMNRLKGE